MTFIYNTALDEWGFNSSGKVTVNGTADSTSSGVTSMLYWGHQVYYYTGSAWFRKSLAADSWVSTTDPRSSVTESSQGDTVSDTTHFLYNSALDKWGINSSGQVTVNGTADTSTSSVTLLLYYSHRVYQYNGTNWYYKAFASDSWTGPTSDPRPAQPTESSQGTSVSDTTTFLYNSAVDKWGINSSGQVTVNDVADTTRSGIVLLLYYNHRVYEENSSGSWWYKSLAADSWTAASDPRTSSTTGTQALSADGFVDSVGVVIHLSYSNIYSTAYSSWSPLLGSLGVRHVRDGAHVSDGQASSTMNTRIKDLNSRFGIKYAFVTDASYVSGSGSNSSKASTMVTWFVNTIGASMIEIVEGMNEPDGGGTIDSNAAPWQQAIYQAIKANSGLSAVTVIGPSLLVESVASAQASSGLGNYMDKGNAHVYQRGIVPEITGTNYNGPGYVKQQFFDVYGSSRNGYWTESGYNSTTSPVTNVATDDRSEGYYCPRGYLWWYKSGTPLRAYKYELLNETNNGDEQSAREASFGLLRNDLSAKPAYTSLKNLIGLLTDAGSTSFSPGKLDFTMGGSTSNITNVLMQKRDGSFILAIWNTSSIFRDQPQPGSDLALATAQTVTITLNNASQSLTSYQTAVINNTGTFSATSTISNHVISISAGSYVTLLRIF